MQSTLLEAGSSSMKLSCTGDLKRLLGRAVFSSWVDFEKTLLLLEDAMESAAALTGLDGLFSSIGGATQTDAACLFGGGDIDLFLDDRNAS